MYENKKLRCKIGFHKYIYIGQQQSSDHYELLLRDIYMCENCCKINERNLNIGGFNETYFRWKPSINNMLNHKKFRKLKIKKILNKIHDK